LTALAETSAVEARGSHGGPARFAFAPDAARAAVLDQAAREGLAASLASVFEALDGAVEIDPGQAAVLLRALEAGPAPPAVFAAYVELVTALFDDREAEAPRHVADLLRSLPFAPQEQRILTLDDADLGAGQAARYARLFIDDLAFDLEPVVATARADAEARLTAALDLLAEGAPGIRAEMDALVRQIVLVSAAVRPDRIAFGGASTFSLWGALAINADRLGGRLETAVSLAHEAAHSLLFGLTLGGRLVENDDETLHPSPLRRDPRPLEGVAHAAYVTARMAYALRALLASDALTMAERGEARDLLAGYEHAARQGFETVMVHARFTPAGAAAFEGLRAYLAVPA